ncbi:ammonia-dependent NAD(+) synthetase [Brachybacterium muris]|uniref:ammonia-dependent NAD(+) synthetase n=1 Tax=Brachybacterium muris TaxID=219301 RepID=UPI00223B16F8|nr:ammonia-dependent NAD(+) synthetase [Brachybacterium muris]MCT1430385.1 ammonia-dependent NAD(+) synthetase [Brachybacterium muris]MCT2260689.1 ammonia-dependent NAD(+) synthetase [Brachybacterium muris]
MRPLQQRIIDETGVKPTIDPAAEVESRIQFLVDYLVATRAKGFVLGISGGVDSTCAGRLAQLAVERVREQGGDALFVAVRLPYGVQHDEADAQAAMDFIAADRPVTVNVAAGVEGLAEAYREGLGEELSDFTKGNTKARMRMAVQYAIGGDLGLLVLGTDQAAENVTGFFTKFGDGGADLLPLFGLNKRQVREVLTELGASDALSGKVPTADLLDGRPGQTDEAELGLRYDDIDDYLEGREIDEAAAEKLETIFLRTRHKRTVPVTIHDTWWRE